jgi:hypothetical protein
MAFEPLVDFHEIWYGGNAIQGDIDAKFLSPYLQPFKIADVERC